METKNLNSLAIVVDGIPGEVSFIAGVGLMIRLAEFDQPMFLSEFMILRGITSYSDEMAKVRNDLSNLKKDE